MKQISLAPPNSGLLPSVRKRKFLDEMNLVIPWSQLLALFTTLASAGKTGRPTFATEVMLRIYLLLQFFGHSDPAMEGALHDIPLYREFAQLDTGLGCLIKSTILCFGRVVKQNDLGVQILAVVNTKFIECSLMLKTGMVVDATLITAPSSTKTTGASETRRCARPRRATSGTSERWRTLAWTPSLVWFAQ